MPRHRGTYNPEREEPYEVSRYQIENFTKCPACFWMNRAKGIKFPGMPGFLLNSATDTLLKKDFDVYREKQKPHPVMLNEKLDHLVPFEHEEFEQWTKSLQLGLRYEYKELNLIIGGGLDDVWHNTQTDEIHIVDYKSTASGMNTGKDGLKKIRLEGNYKEGYKRQMDVYTWILRKKGFKASNKGYFVYVNGDQHFEDGMLNKDGSRGNMGFEVQLISYFVNTSWIEPTLKKLKECLDSETCPEHAQTGFGYKGDQPCEYLRLFDGMREHGLMN
mgnify:FL=1